MSLTTPRPVMDLVDAVGRYLVRTEDDGTGCDRTSCEACAACTYDSSKPFEHAHGCVWVQLRAALAAAQPKAPSPSEPKPMVGMPPVTKALSDRRILTKEDLDNLRIRAAKPFADQGDGLDSSDCDLLFDYIKYLEQKSPSLLSFEQQAARLADVCVKWLNEQYPNTLLRNDLAERLADTLAEIAHDEFEPIPMKPGEVERIVAAVTSEPGEPREAVDASIGPLPEPWESVARDVAIRFSLSKHRVRSIVKPHVPKQAPSPTPGEVDRLAENSERLSEIMDKAGWPPLRAALPAQGWSKQLPTEPGWYWCFPIAPSDSDAVSLNELRSQGGILCQGLFRVEHKRPCWWMPASVPTPPNAEPKS